MGIEWCHESWNPSVGCTKVSPGCKNCYAERLAHRLKAMGVPAYADGFKLSWHPERLNLPRTRKRPTIYFVNSMSDLFHEDLPWAFIDAVLETIRATPQHIYQILTKRPEVMKNYFADRAIPPNVWLGVSVEDQKYGVPRIAVLRTLPATVRFISAEPLLADLGAVDLSGITWVIVGGESGPKARRMQPAWVDNLHAQCRRYQCRFFFKQWGAYGPDGHKRSKKANGREYGGRKWNEMPLVFQGALRPGVESPSP